jgi:hypothetical protein
MAITSLDLKFHQAERMTDFSDGGGRMSAVEIVDNQMNNVFSDRSDADADLGRVSLRKLFFGIFTANTDIGLGARVFLTDPPADPLVSVLLFYTGSVTDERVQARNYVENYRVVGVKSQFTLYGDHFVGMRTVQVYCRPEIPSPDIGDVLVLSVEADGYTPHQQFVQVEEVETRGTYTFTDASGDFQRDVLIIRMTSALTSNFEGQQDPVRITGANPPPTLVRLSQVADAARYYGMKPVTEAVSQGATVIDIGDPYIPIAPSARAETPLVDLLAGLGTVSMVASGAAGALTWSGNVSAGANAPVTRYLGSPFARRSLSVTIGAVVLHDDGSGNIVADNPSDVGWSGVADYITGAVVVQRAQSWSGTLALQATPAGAVIEQGYTLPRVVTANNRAISQVFQLPNLPARGTTLVDYRALGKWIRLRDNGAGQLVGNPGEGGGSVNYATGSIAVTLGALPDIDSAILVSWGIDTRARNSSGEVTIPAPRFEQQLDHGNVLPGDLEMTWVSGGVPRTATADMEGKITGDATGEIDETAGLVHFTTTHLPDAAITYSYKYVDGGVHSEVFTPTAAGGFISVTLANAPVAEGSVRASFSRTRVIPGQPNRRFYHSWARDDGDGGWVGPGSTPGGAIDYTDGELALQVEGD